MFSVNLQLAILYFKNKSKKNVEVIFVFLFGGENLRMND